MLMLLETYQKYFSEESGNPNFSIDEPESVHNYTLATLKQACNEGVAEFIREKIEFTGEYKIHFIPKGQLHKAYENYISISKGPNHKSLKQTNFYEGMSKIKSVKERRVNNCHVYTAEKIGDVFVLLRLWIST
jgi:hypothetical protein